MLYKKWNQIVQKFPHLKQWEKLFYKNSIILANNTNKISKFYKKSKKIKKIKQETNLDHPRDRQTSPTKSYKKNKFF